MNSNNQRKITNFDKIQVGDHLSETQYYRVTSKTTDKIGVSNERGFTFTVSNNIVEEGMFSANQYDQEVKMSRGEVVEKLENAKDTIFMVNFNKLPNDKSVLEKLKNMKITDLSNEKAMKALSKEMMLGEERTLIGHLCSSEPRMGRSSVIDLEIPVGQHRQRLVDHRTVNWLIIQNVKYVVK